MEAGLIRLTMRAMCVRWRGGAVCACVYASDGARVHCARLAHRKRDRRSREARAEGGGGEREGDVKVQRKEDRWMQREHLETSFGQCARAYSLVSAEHLARTLGVPVGKVNEMADASHWTTDAETGAYVPVSVEPPVGKVELMAQLKVLTDYVAHVEKELK